MSLDTDILSFITAHASQFSLRVARIVAAFAWMPFLGSGAIVSGLSRAVLAAVVAMGLWGVATPAEWPVSGMGTAVALLTEGLAGMVLGMSMAWPFLLFHAVGIIADSQRGASVSSMLNPLSGIEATEMANLLQLASVTLFLATGGLPLVVEMLAGSYRVLPVGSPFRLDTTHVVSFIQDILMGAVRISAPLLIVLLLCEIFLGLLSRFAQQMNAFSVSLGLKSFVAFMALLVYMVPTMQRELASQWGWYEFSDWFVQHPSRP